MMMGPTKKKVIIAGVVAFTIPTIAFGAFTYGYAQKKNKEIEELKIKSTVTQAYVLTDNLVEGDEITSSDLIKVDIKGESAPIDSFSGDKWELVGRRVRINAEKKTIVTESMLMDEVDVTPGLSERLQEFNMLLLPSDLEAGDYVDIRITMPDGENYIVVSGKEVKKLGTSLETNTVFLQLDEEEIIRTTAAILESYMSDGIKVYVTKYVDPSAQLYKSERIDYVQRYKDAIEKIYSERVELASGDAEKYIEQYGTTPEKVEELREMLEEDLKITVSKDDITNSEIARAIGLPEKQVVEIKLAIENNDSSILNFYNDKLLRTRLDMKETYPVKQNIANLIINNPNILNDIKAKYNVEELLAKRATLQDFKNYKIDEYTGELVPTEALTSLQTNLNKEIELQKSERKEYLQALLLEEE